MELDANLIALQSELKTLEKNIDKFSKIKYKGGNDEKVEAIIGIIKRYSSKSHLPSNEHNRQQFLLFLIVNSNLEDNLLLHTKEFQHLVNVIPTLTSCLLANIIVSMDFISDYCKIMQKVSLKVNKQLIYEIEVCLTNCDLTKTLKDSTTLLKALINFFQVTEDNEIAEQICDASVQMLKNFSYFNPDKVQQWKSTKFYEHIGHSLLHVLQIVNGCSTSRNYLIRLLNSGIGVAIAIMKAVTLNVYCVWAQVKCEDGTPLQLVIAGEAFLTIEHLQKYKLGQELVQMLSTIAKKPKGLSEKIIEADLLDVIANINRCDDNQILWFRALIGANVFKSDDAIACLEKWCHLCGPDDISRLLNLCNSPQDKVSTLKYAQMLSVENLKNVIIKYFWEHDNYWTENIQDELILFLNKFENTSDIEDDTVKLILLMIFKNCELVLKTLYTKCLEKVAIVSNLKNLFSTIKSIVEVKGFAQITFSNVIHTHLPCEENILNYRDLCNLLLELGYVTDSFINAAFKIRLELAFCEENETNLFAILKLFNSVEIKFDEMEEDELPVFTLQVLEKYRSEFYQFTSSPFIIQECVNLLSKFKTVKPYYNGKAIKLSQINKFYTQKCSTSSKFLMHIYGSQITQNHTEAVAKLIKILPICVKSEWILIINEIGEHFNYESTLKIFNDVLFLISQLKINKEEDSARVLYYLQQYSIIIKEILQPKHNTLKEEQMLAKHLCTLLKNIPQAIRQKEAVRLTSLLTNDVLKSLKDDREFILLLVAIQDTGVSQFLAQRMLS